MNHPWGELANVPGADGSRLKAHALNLALAAVAADGVQTLLLPAERVTAVHEAGHAVIHAAKGTPPFVVRVWHEPLGHGYSGTCDFAPGALGLTLHPRQQPHAALSRACVTLAGWAAELWFERDGFKLGSSLDEMMVAGGLVRSAADALAWNAETLWMNTLGATLWVLQQEQATVRAIQRALIREHRVRGPKLATLLQPVQQRDLATLVLGGRRPPKEEPKP